MISVFTVEPCSVILKNLSILFENSFLDDIVILCARVRFVLVSRFADARYLFAAVRRSLALLAEIVQPKTLRRLILLMLTHGYNDQHDCCNDIRQYLVDLCR